MKEIKLKVDGMSCEHCKKAVNGALAELDGVQAVEVSVKRGEAEVSYDETKVTLEQMKDAIEDQGYDVK
ncbi:MAG TPA: copper chaperone CopZ [Bacillales bacterium]|nr:copper chaperone CopZ [Bacillales bacterium]